MNWQVEPHKWVPFKGIGRKRCAKCGLLALNNKFSQWCVKMGCDHDLHPNYKHQRDTCQDG